MSVYMTAARSAPRSEPANSHDFVPNGKPRSARSAAMLARQMRPSSRKRVKAGQRVSMESIALATSAWRESLARSARIQLSRPASRPALCSRGARKRCSAVRPLMPRSMSKIASMRLRVSNAIGEIGVACPPRRSSGALVDTAFRINH